MLTIPAIECNYSNPAPTPQLFDGSTLKCNPKKVREINFFRTNNLARISTLLDSDGTKFIVKQDDTDMVTCTCRAAREKLGVAIATDTYLNTNKVLIIPAYYNFPGKRSVELPATLHTFSPGIQISFIDRHSPFHHLNIHQRHSSSLAPKDCGLTYTIIQNMTKHSELPIITALDTFIGNRARHTNNLFYCPDSNHFYLIDLESAFKTDLGMYACNCITSLLKEKTTLSHQEITALRSYHTTLKMLLSRYSPEQMYTLLLSYIAEANPALEKHLAPHESSNDIDHNSATALKKRLTLHKIKIDSNYASCQKLVELLDTLLVNQGKNL